MICEIIQLILVLPWISFILAYFAFSVIKRTMRYKQAFVEDKLEMVYQAAQMIKAGIREKEAKEREEHVTKRKQELEKHLGKTLSEATKGVWINGSFYLLLSIEGHRDIYINFYFEDLHYFYKKPANKYSYDYTHNFADALDKTKKKKFWLF